MRESKVPPRRARLVRLAVFGFLGVAAVAQAQQAQQAPMNQMDHGPFVSSTITLDPTTVKGIVVHKGIAVKVGRDATMVFDTDLLRVVAGWTGGLLHWLPARDSLQEWPTPDGHVHFLNTEKAGWSTTADLTDTRAGSATLNNAKRFGPIGGNRRYEGLHVQGDDVVLSFTVGGAKVLEKFGFERAHGEPLFTRTINIGATSEKLTALVVSAPVGAATRLEQGMISAGAGYVTIDSGDEVRLIGFRGLPEGVKWNLERGHLSLSLPALPAGLRFQLAMGPVRRGAYANAMRALLSADPGTLDLKRYLEPGPARYQPLETAVEMGSDDGPFAVDTVALPSQNPWRSHLRLSAVDFMADGRAVVASLSGDVWIVDGIGRAPGRLRWQRFATGLNQPLGLVVVDDTVYVNGRDQITRLRDIDKDGSADHYENFTNVVMAGTNFHGFNLNLEVDAQGRFLWAKSTSWPTGDAGDLSDAALTTPHDGVLFRASPDGRDVKIIATGLRNPNGLSVGPKGEIYFSDNEGNWVPTSKLTRIVEGEFHGFVPSAHRANLVSGWAPADGWVKPFAWTPHGGPGSDNSPAQARVIDNAAWPKELQGHLLLASYGRGSLSLVLMEEVEGQPQAAHLVLPLRFRSGLQHMRFHRDGHLYVVGMTNWSSTSHAGDRGSFHRVRYTGKPLHLPTAVSTKQGAIELRFSDELDPASATNPASYQLSKWTYPWNATYGSKQLYSLDRPGQPGPDPVVVESIRLAADRRTVHLQIPGLTQNSITTVPITGKLPHQIEASMGMVVQIAYDVKAADGTPLKQLLHKTIHRVPGNAPVPSSGSSTNPTTAVAERGPVGPPASAGPAAPESRGRVVVVRSKGTELSYEPSLIKAKAGERLTIRFENVGDMTHNIVVVKAEADIPVIGEASFQAAFTNQWIPTGPEVEARMLAHTPLAGPGETVEVTLTAPAAGEYPFICTYASHWTVMRGTLSVDK